MYKFSSTFATTPDHPSNCSDKAQDEKVLDGITHCYLSLSKLQLLKEKSLILTTLHFASICTALTKGAILFP